MSFKNQNKLKSKTTTAQNNTIFTTHPGKPDIHEYGKFGITAPNMIIARPVMVNVCFVPFFILKMTSLNIDAYQ